jgi:hypothetical protein
MGWLPVSLGTVVTVTYTMLSNTCLVTTVPTSRSCLRKLLDSQSSVVEDSVLPRCDLLVVLVPIDLKDDNIFIYMVRQSVMKGLLDPLDPEG